MTTGTTQTTMTLRSALGAAKAQASVSHGHRMTERWMSIPEDDDDGAATWFCRCADCGMAVIFESMTSKIGGCAYDTDCPGGPKPEDA